MSDRVETKRSGFFGWVRTIDDGVFAVEQAIVALALIGITVLMFVNVLARRIQAQDSKVGAVIAKLLGVTDLEERARLDANVAPWVTVVLSFALIVFGYYTWQRFVRRRKKLDPPPIARSLGIGAAVAAVLVALGWGFSYAFLQMQSATLFAGIFGVAALGYVIHVVRSRPPGFALRAAAGVLGGAGVVWFCLAWFPIGYTWTFKVSLMLLLWVGMLGASVCVHEGKHIRMEALSKLAPPRVQRYLVAAGFFVAACLAACMMWLGVLYTFDPTASDDPVYTELITLGGTRYVFGMQGMYGLDGFVEGTEIPDWIGTFSVVVGFGLATFRFLGAGLSWALGGDYGAPAPEEGLAEAREHAKGETAEAAS